MLASIPKCQFNIRYISKENSLCFTLVANIELQIHILQEKSNLRSHCKFKFAFSSEIQIENIKEAAPGLLFCLISAHFGKFILHSMRSYVRTKLMHLFYSRHAILNTVYLGSRYFFMLLKYHRNYFYF